MSHSSTRLLKFLLLFLPPHIYLILLSNDITLVILSAWHFVLLLFLKLNGASPTLVAPYFCWQHERQPYMSCSYRHNLHNAVSTILHKRMHFDIICLLSYRTVLAFGSLLPALIYIIFTILLFFLSLCVCCFVFSQINVSENVVHILVHTILCPMYPVYNMQYPWGSVALSFI